MNLEGPVAYNDTFNDLSQRPFGVSQKPYSHQLRFFVPAFLRSDVCQEHVVDMEYRQLLGRGRPLLHGSALEKAKEVCLLELKIIAREEEDSNFYQLCDQAILKFRTGNVADWGPYHNTLNKLSQKLETDLSEGSQTPYTDQLRFHCPAFLRSDVCQEHVVDTEYRQLLGKCKPLLEYRAVSKKDQRACESAIERAKDDCLQELQIIFKEEDDSNLLKLCDQTILKYRTTCVDEVLQFIKA